LAAARASRRRAPAVAKGAPGYGVEISVAV
jgi:hypothetical protein